MTFAEILSVISLITGLLNLIGMGLMYLRYLQIIRGSFVMIRADGQGDVETVDLLMGGERL